MGPVLWLETLNIHPFVSGCDISNPLVSSNATEDPSECAIYSRTSSADPLAISPFRLTQRHQLSGVILSALVEFWTKSSKRPSVEGSSISHFYITTPPFWIVYHLAGHPCNTFREYVISLVNFAAHINDYSWLFIVVLLMFRLSNCTVQCWRIWHFREGRVQLEPVKC